MQNRNLLAYCNNQATVEIINKGKANNLFAQKCLREICYLTGKSNAIMRVVYLPSEENRILDSLSRGEEPSQRLRFNNLTMGYTVRTLAITEEDFEFSHNW